jgi:hypothetical protein
MAFLYGCAECLHVTTQNGVSGPGSCAAALVEGGLVMLGGAVAFDELYDEVCRWELSSATLTLGPLHVQSSLHNALQPCLCSKRC